MYNTFFLSPIEFKKKLVSSSLTLHLFNYLIMIYLVMLHINFYLLHELNCTDSSNACIGLLKMLYPKSTVLQSNLFICEKTTYYI